MRSSLKFEDVKKIFKFVQNSNNNNLLCNKAIGKLANCFLDIQIRLQLKNYNIPGLLFNIYKERGNDEDIATQLVRALANLCDDKAFVDSIMEQRPGKILRNMADKSTNVIGLNNCLRLIKKLTNFHEVLNKLIYTEDIINTLIIFFNKTYLYSVAAQSQLGDSFFNDNYFKFTSETEQEIVLRNILDLLSLLLNAFNRFQNQNNFKRLSKFNVLNFKYDEIDVTELAEDFIMLDDKSKDEMLDHSTNTSLTHIESPQLRLAYDLKFLESILAYFVFEFPNLTSISNRSTHSDKPPPVTKLMISLLKITTLNHLFGSIGAVKVMLVLLRQNVFDENYGIIAGRVDSPKAIYLTQCLYLLSREASNRARIRDFGGLRLLACMADELGSTFCQKDQAPNSYSTYCLTIIISCLTNFLYEQASMVSLGEYGLLEVLNKTLKGYLLWGAVGCSEAFICKVADKPPNEPAPELAKQSLDLAGAAISTEEPPLVKTCEDKEVQNQDSTSQLTSPGLALSPSSDSGPLSPPSYEKLRELMNSPLYSSPSPPWPWPYPSPRGNMSPSSSCYSYGSSCGAEWEDGRTGPNYYSSEEEYFVECAKQLPISPPRSAAQSPIPHQTYLQAKAREDAKTLIDVQSFSKSQFAASTSKNTDLMSKEMITIRDTSTSEVDCPICCARKFVSSGLEHRLLENTFSLLLQLFRLYHYNPSSLFAQHHGILTTMLDVFRCSQNPHRKLIRALNRVAKNDRLFDILVKYKFPLYVYKTLLIFWSQNSESTLSITSKLSTANRDSPPLFHSSQRKRFKRSDDLDSSMTRNTHADCDAKEGDSASLQCSSCALKARFLEKLMKALQKSSMTSFAMCVIQAYVFRPSSDGPPSKLPSEEVEAALLSLPFLFRKKYMLRKMLRTYPYIATLRAKMNKCLEFGSQDADPQKAMGLIEDVMLGLHYVSNLQIPHLNESTNETSTSKILETTTEPMIISPHTISSTDKIIKLYPDNISPTLQQCSYVQVSLALMQNQSPVFAAMFNERGNFLESNTDSLNLVGSDIEEIKLFVDLLSENSRVKQKSFLKTTIANHLSCYSLSHRYMVTAVEDRLRTKILPSFILNPRTSKSDTGNDENEIDRNKNGGEFAFADIYVYLTSHNFVEASQTLCEAFVKNLPRMLYDVTISNRSISEYLLVDTQLAEIARNASVFANLFNDTLSIYEKYIADL